MKTCLAVCAGWMAAIGGALALAGGPEFDADRLKAIPGQVDAVIEAGEVAGAVGAIVTKDGLVYLQPSGYSDLEAKEPMQADSIFWIASMTKQFPAILIMMLEEQGKLSIDDPVSKFIPEFAQLRRQDGSVPPPVLIRHLLSHMAGLPENTAEETESAVTLQDLIPPFVARPMQFEPGERWLYSQTAINSLGRIVEVIAGEPFDVVLDRELLIPLGMKDSTFYLTEEQERRLAKSYVKREGGLKEVPIPYLGSRDFKSRDRIPLANGGMFSTAGDMARLFQMLLNGGELDGKRYLKPETIQKYAQIQTGSEKPHSEGCGWGLGFMVVSQPTRTSESLSVGTFGHAGAHGTQSWLDPERDIALILMVQISNAPDPIVQKTFFKAATEALAE